MTSRNMRKQQNGPRHSALMVSALAFFFALAGCGSFMTQTAIKPAKVYVGNFKDNTISAIDIDARKVIATVPVSAGPHGMAISRDGRVVYVSGDGTSLVDVIDTASNKVVKTIEVGKTPNGIALTPDDRMLLVTVYGEDRLD